ncbi:hypothetical protein FB567DRAFT_553812 [Paraphoma chrysanthemicola]|uniref:Heterokaryon incompatibility domain-containing protein n=1 Tax=Paraphoma chrysanthemicola TaxID=798071 RepID=A0A8K0VSS5_9PLEO|nr:hypothetical protein FB567DRAFT_553812 [Paraphoma chrysanthemicola]
MAGCTNGEFGHVTEGRQTELRLVQDWFSTTRKERPAGSSRSPSFHNDINKYILVMLLIQIDGGHLSIVECFGAAIPPYLVLSHTWGHDGEEVTFKDMRKGRGHDKLSYNKLKFCVRQTLEHGLEHFWIDTCCTGRPDHNALRNWVLLPPEKIGGKLLH